MDSTVKPQPLNISYFTRYHSRNVELAPRIINTFANLFLNPLVTSDLLLS